MKRNLAQLFFWGFLSSSCSSLETSMNIPPKYPVNSVSKGMVQSEVEREFQQLNSTYTQNTKELVEVMMNSGPNDEKVAISIENASPCNMVVAVSGNGQLKKIPVGVGQTRGLVVRKGQYRLSTKVCSSLYDEVKLVNETLILKLDE